MGSQQCCNQGQLSLGVLCGGLIGEESAFRFMWVDGRIHFLVVIY